MRKDNKDMEMLYESVYDKGIKPIEAQNVGNLEYITEMAYGVGGSSQPITVQGLMDKIQEYEKTGARPVSFTFVVGPQGVANKRGNPFYPMYKVSQVNGMLGPDYEAGVNREREKQGMTPDYTAQAPTGKEHISRALVRGTNTGRISVTIQPTRTSSPIYYGKDPDTGVMREMTPDEAAQYKKPPYVPRAGASGVVRNYKTYGLDGAVGYKQEGQDYLITDMADATKKQIGEDFLAAHPQV